MPAKTPAISYDAILREVNAGKFRPIYYLMGEEAYYTDRIADYIVDHALEEDEKAFNLLTVFGLDTTIEAIMDTARGYPMGAQRLVVCVKEAQNLKNIENLEHYAKQPQPSTVLIFCHKNGSLDRRKKLPALIENAGGVVYESVKLRDYQLPTFIQDYMARRRVPIHPQAVTMMADYVGADLNRMAGELDKLCIAANAQGQTVQPVTGEMVAAHIGISKEYNIFELQEALVNKNVAKAMQIANYFDKNQKTNPIQKTLPSLFRCFSNIMMAYYSPDKSEAGLASWLSMSSWQVKKNVSPALRNYSGMKVMQILSEIRRTDARSKGVGNPFISTGDLMRELLYFILH
ncbi:MAG: DNA polymerase III subunit delta [Alloprevotella sp.]|nr:DNA polymerase III subunit delta [Alloprevotella sp.]